MTTRPYLKLYVGDYQADTPHLTTEQHGAYLLLLMAYWSKGSLPTDERELARITKMTPSRWAKNRDALARFFNAGWTQGRMEFELSERARLSEAGRRGGLAAKRQANGQRKPKPYSHSHKDPSFVVGAPKPVNSGDNS